jgi:DNA-binding NarL/FixJ family response regulator
MQESFSPKLEVTSREKNVLTLMGEGYSNKQIARKLHLAECTIITHTMNIFRKLHVNNRTHAVAIALKNNLI